MARSAEGAALYRVPPTAELEHGVLGPHNGRAVRAFGVLLLALDPDRLPRVAAWAPDDEAAPATGSDLLAHRNVPAMHLSSLLLCPR